MIVDTLLPVDTSDFSTIASPIMGTTYGTDTAAVVIASAETDARESTPIHREILRSAGGGG